MNLSRAIRKAMANDPAPGEMAVQAVAVFRKKLAEEVARKPPPALAASPPPR